MAVGLSGAVVAFAGAWLYFRRELRQRQRHRVGPSPQFDSRPERAVADSMSTETLATVPPGALHSPPRGSAIAEVRLPGSPREGATALSAPARSTGELGLPTRLSQRILLHVARQGGGALEGTAPHALCQAGIAETLGASQGALAGVLRRLELGGVLTSARAHVEGHDRRLKVYRLTPRGEDVVRRLWKEFPNSTAPQNSRGSRALHAEFPSRVVVVREPRNS